MVMSLVMLDFRREALSLAASWALGMVLIGKGSAGVSHKHQGRNDAAHSLTGALSVLQSVAKAVICEFCVGRHLCRTRIARPSRSAGTIGSAN
jgi:hypothetical protein